MKFLSIVFLLTFGGVLQAQVEDFKSHPAFQAISNRQVDKLSELLKKNKKWAQKIENEHGKTLLHYATIMNHPDMVELLIQHKADVNRKDKQKSTPLIYSVRKHFKDKKDRQNQFKIIEMLIKNKAHLSQQDQLKEDALTIASYNGNIRVVKLLLNQKSIPLDNLNMYKQNALHAVVLGAIASRKEDSHILNNYISIAKLLIEKGVDVNTVDSNTRAPFHYMAEHGFTEMLQASLKKKNIQINLQTKEGWSALHLASGNKSIKNIELLVSHGANVDLKDQTGLTPIYLAVGSGSKEAVALLLKARAQVFFKDKDGNEIFDNQTSKKLKELIAKFRGSS